MSHFKRKIQNDTPKPFLFLYEKTKHEAQITTKPHFGVRKKTCDVIAHKCYSTMNSTTCNSTTTTSTMNSITTTSTTTSTTTNSTTISTTTMLLFYAGVFKFHGTAWIDRRGMGGIISLSGCLSHSKATLSIMFAGKCFGAITLAAKVWGRRWGEYVKQ